MKTELREPPENYIIAEWHRGFWIYFDKDLYGWSYIFSLEPVGYDMEACDFYFENIEMARDAALARVKRLEDEVARCEYCGEHVTLGMTLCDRCRYEH